MSPYFISLHKQKKRVAAAAAAIKILAIEKKNNIKIVMDFKIQSGMFSVVYTRKKKQNVYLIDVNKITFDNMHNLVLIFLQYYQPNFHFDEEQSNDYIEYLNTFEMDQYYLNKIQIKIII